MRESKTRSSVEVLLARFALAWIPRLSRPSVLRLASFLGKAAYGLSRHLRQVGRANLDLAFGASLSPQQKGSILKRSFENFSLVMLDSFWFSRDTEARIRQHVRFDPGCEQVFRRKAQICVTAHLGNWEVLGLAFVQQGFPMVSVAAPLANPGIDALFNELRARTGQQVVSKHGVLRSLLKTLKDEGKIGLLLDQNTKPGEGGVWVSFFGLPVPVSSAAAALQAHTKAEIVFGACLPQPDGMYRVPPPDFLEIPESGNVVAITQEVTRATERWVRANPEHWLWTYKRWKYVAPGHRREEFPFYAKTTFADS